MNGHEYDWKKIAHNVGGFILACALCFGIAMVLIYYRIEDVMEEAKHWKDIEAEVVMKNPPGIIGVDEICIVNLNDWQWPLAELRINAKGRLTDVTYKLRAWDWVPKEKRCFWSREFKHWKYGWEFRGSRSDIETFTITVKKKGWLDGDTIGIWVGGRKSK